MSTILKCEDRNFQEDPNKIDNFKLFSDVTRKKKGLIPINLNFDLRLLNPGHYSAPYHSHRSTEELFMIISGSLTLRTPNGLDIVSPGDLAILKLRRSKKATAVNAHTILQGRYVQYLASINITRNT